MQRMICIPSEQYNQMLESYDNAMRELQEIKEDVYKRQVNDMPYEPYVTYEYYCDAYKGDVIPMNELDKALKQASRHVDSLTYNRIVGRGFSNLTAFQQDVIQEVV